MAVITNRLADNLGIETIAPGSALPGTPHATGWGRALCGATVLLIGQAGCSPAPSQNILGSYFPSWMLCALVGLVLTFAVHQLFVATGIHRTLPAPLVVYLAIAVALAFSTWLIWLT